MVFLSLLRICILKAGKCLKIELGVKVEII